MMSQAFRISALMFASFGALIHGVAFAAEKNPEKEAYFGQTHQHTSWSLDAYILGNTVAGPAESYQFAMGKAIKHPAGFMVQLKRPLDFHGVTDHAEYVGMLSLANDPKSPVSKLPIASKLKVHSPSDVMRIFQWMAGSLAKGEKIEPLLQPELTNEVWRNNTAIANQYYKPGTFTTFCAYEWTSMPGNQNMHRNVFFKDCGKLPPAPFSAIDSDKPEDLWTWLETQRKQGNEALAISHNANLSNGLMFPVDVDSKGRPIDAAWAQQRMANEPLTEIKQVKGQSETNPGLSPNDEFANFEVMNYLIGLDNSFSKLQGSYIRQAYQNGLALQDTRGFNPYKMGVVGAGDSHNTATNYSQSNYFGDHGEVDATPEKRLAGTVASGMNILQTGTSGLAGVWAEENTREALFAAMQRKEVFGTSGVRIKVRMFGGWEYPSDTLHARDWVKVGYARGVPMGGDLPEMRSKAPQFIVQAVKDPDDGNLDRIQVVKGWTKNGQIFEKIYDVAWSGDRKIDPATGKLPPVGSTVNIKDATYTNTIGSVELKTLWSDPEFDPSLNAFYYARVLQIPTPRWSTYDAKKLGILPPSDVAAEIQERAWTTPIWYSPSEEARKHAAPGTKVADLRQQGAVALSDDQLKATFVGKTAKVINSVDGTRFDVLYGTDGRCVVTGLVDEAQGQKGESQQASLWGNSANYVIRDGKLITTINGSPFEVTVFKQGNKYLAARSNEFGFANYEVVPAEAKLAGL